MTEKGRGLTRIVNNYGIMPILYENNFIVGKDNTLHLDGLLIQEDSKIECQEFTVIRAKM